MRRSILARVKFLSRLLTALNLLPSIATLASSNRPIVRHSTTNRAHTLRIARPLSLRKSAIVLWSGTQPARQPHHLDIAPGLALKPPARLDPVEIAVNVELQEDRGMIRRPPGRLRIDPAEPELGQIELLDKDIDHTNRIVLVDPIFQAFGKQRRLPTIHPLNKALHRDPPKIASLFIMRGVFTQPGSKPVKWLALTPL